MKRYDYRVRKDRYAWSRWYAERLEWGNVVTRYDFATERSRDGGRMTWTDTHTA